MAVETSSAVMRYAIMITGAPGSGALSTAYQFCHTALDLHHTISIVFFYQDSVRLLQEMEQLEKWRALQQAHALSYHLCSAAVARHHIDSSETLGFSISGLGVWSQEMGLADRVMLFKEGN